MTTLREKVQFIKENYPEVYMTLEVCVPNLLENPENPTPEDLDHYNFWVDSIDEDEAQPLYHLINN